MNTTNAVGAYLNPELWGQMEKVATALVQSQAFPKNIKNGPQAMVVMQAGMEMGMAPMESINSITIINGAISIYGKAITRRLREHGWKIQYETLNDRGGGMRATVSKADETYIETLYFDQAEKSKWTQMYNYDKKQFELKPGWYEGANRLLKLRYGVLSMIIKTYLAEVMGSAQEIAEVAEDYIIEEVTPAPETKPKTEQVMIAQPDDRKESLKEFIENEKNKPKTTEKVKKIENTTSNPAKNSVKPVETAEKATEVKA